MKSETLYEFDWDVDGDINEENLQWAYDWLRERWDGNAVLVDGHLGLWDGIHTVAGLFWDLKDAIRSMNPSTIRIVGGCKVVVESRHHDGTNRFELRQLTAKGAKWLDNQAPTGRLGAYAPHLIDTEGYSRNFIRRGE